jgi:hypothetical protein
MFCVAETRIYRLRASRVNGKGLAGQSMLKGARDELLFWNK